MLAGAPVQTFPCACLAVLPHRSMQPEHFGSLALPVGEFLALLHGTSYVGYAATSSTAAKHPFFAQPPRPSSPSMGPPPAAAPVQEGQAHGDGAGAMGVPPSPGGAHYRRARRGMGTGLGGEEVQDDIRLITVHATTSFSNVRDPKARANLLCAQGVPAAMQGTLGRGLAG